jgi:hypothetical protein
MVLTANVSFLDANTDLGTGDRSGQLRSRGQTDNQNRYADQDYGRKGTLPPSPAAHVLPPVSWKGDIFLVYLQRG